MGKTMAYVATAILLGVVTMLPVIIFTPKRADQGYIFDGDMRVLRADVESYSSETLNDVDVAAAPSGPFHTVLIMVVSLVCAFGVSFYFKTKII